jgi:Uma2 family endonuclease
MATTKLMTAEELEQMPDDRPGRYDLIDGELIWMPPPGEEHGDCISNIFGALILATRPLGIGRAYTDTGFVVGRNPDQVVSPNVAFIRTERLDPGRNRKGYFRVAPDFAVEIVSPSDYPLILERKIAKYMAAGVPLLWIVYPDERRVRVLGAGREPTEFDERDVLDGGEVVPGFRLPVADIFA